MGAKRILALGSVAALCAGAAAPLFMVSAASAAVVGGNATSLCTNNSKTLVIGVNLPPTATTPGTCRVGIGEQATLLRRHPVVHVAHLRGERGDLACELLRHVDGDRTP